MTPLSQPPEAVVRTLVAVGAGAQDAGCELSRRRPGEILNLASLAEAVEMLDRLPDGVVYVLVEALRTELDDLMAAAAAAASRADLSVGFLCGRGAAELLSAVRRLPRRPPVASASQPQKLFAAPDQPATLSAARLVPQNLAWNNPEAVVDRLTGPSELTFLVGHANAMHLTVGGAVLCGRSLASAGPDELGVYPCFHGDPCHFAPNRNEVEVRADRLQAKRVIALSCYGVSFVETPFARAFSLGQSLLQQGRVETLITALRAATVNSSDLAILYYLVNAGLALGNVAVRANRFRLSQGMAAEWFCFGDPESRVEESLIKVPIRREDGWLVLDPGEDEGAPRDLVAELPPMSIPEDPILLEDSAGDLLAAVLDPAGQIYVSVPGDWKRRPARMRVAGREEMLDPAGTARQLLSDLSFLDTYLPLIDPGPNDRRLLEVRDANHALQALLRSWPLAEYPRCLRLEARQLRALWKELRHLVEKLGDRFLALYTALMIPDQRTHPTPWDSRFRTAASEVDSVDCAYCGRKIDEFVMEARLASTRRRWGLCRNACAYVWDGDPLLGRWLEIPASFEAGNECAFAISAQNPYGGALDSFAVGVLKHFEDGRSQPGQLTRVAFEPRESRRVKLRLEVPVSFRPGVYHLSACLMLGAQFNFYRAQVPVTRSQ